MGHPKFNDEYLMIGDRITFNDGGDIVEGVIRSVQNQSLLVAYRYQSEGRSIMSTCTVWPEADGTGGIFIVSHTPAGEDPEKRSKRRQWYLIGARAALSAVQDAKLPHPGGSSRHNTRDADVAAIHQLLVAAELGMTELPLHQDDYEMVKDGYREGLRTAYGEISRSDPMPNATWSATRRTDMDIIQSLIDRTYESERVPEAGQHPGSGAVVDLQGSAGELSGTEILGQDVDQRTSLLEDQSGGDHQGDGSGGSAFQAIGKAEARDTPTGVELTVTWDPKYKRWANTRKQAEATLERLNLNEYRSQAEERLGEIQRMVRDEQERQQEESLHKEAPEDSSGSR